MTFGGMITAIGALGIVVGIATIVLMVVKMHRHDDWFDDDPEPKQSRPPTTCSLARSGYFLTPGPFTTLSTMPVGRRPLGTT